VIETLICFNVCNAAMSELMSTMLCQRTLDLVTLPLTIIYSSGLGKVCSVCEAECGSPSGTANFAKGFAKGFASFAKWQREKNIVPLQSPQ